MTFYRRNVVIGPTERLLRSARIRMQNAEDVETLIDGSLATNYAR